MYAWLFTDSLFLQHSISQVTCFICLCIISFTEIYFIEEIYIYMDIFMPLSIFFKEMLVCGLWYCIICILNQFLFPPFQSMHRRDKSRRCRGDQASWGEQKNNFFCSVACGRGENKDRVYAITKSGFLCEINSNRLLDKWVELRVRF